jgi:hypothetical protein
MEASDPSLIATDLRKHKIHCDTRFSPRFQPKMSVSFTTFEVLTQPPKTC